MCSLFLAAWTGVLSCEGALASSDMSVMSPTEPRDLHAGLQEFGRLQCILQHGAPDGSNGR